VRIWQRLKTEDIPLAATGFNSCVRRFLSFNRLMNFFSPGDLQHPDLESTSIKVSHPTSFNYELKSLSGDMVQICLAGVFDTPEAAKIDYKELLHTIGERDCIVDLSTLSYIGTSGLMLLLNISKYILNHGKCFVICSLQENVRQLLQMAGLNRLFVILNDMTAAKQFVQEVRGEVDSRT
jgi:anti-anti-sigma factor